MAQSLTQARTFSKQVQANGAGVHYPTVESTVGWTPLVRLQRLPGKTSNNVLAKLEGNNPAGSVKDRPALSMISEAEKAGKIKPGDTLIEATSGNTGIAMAMAAAIKGYKLTLLMPSNMSAERKQSMAAYGAKLIEVEAGKMEVARDQALAMQQRGEGFVLDQYGNPDNPLAHYRGTAPEIWEQTQGQITHFISSMGTTGTIMGCQRYFKEQSKDVTIIGLQPSEGTSIPGIRKWPKEYVPTIFNESLVDRICDISQYEAEETMRALAKSEGIFAGVSSGGSIAAALRLSYELENATIVAIVCDRGDRYLSTGVYSEESAVDVPVPCTAEEYPSSMARLISLPGPHYIFFSASYSGHDGTPWCSDCKRAYKAARRRVEAVGGTFLEVHVGTIEEWKSSDHVLRKDPRVNLTTLPTLVKWNAEERSEISRLSTELSGLTSEDAVEKIVGAFVEHGSGV